MDVTTPGSEISFFVAGLASGPGKALETMAFIRFTVRDGGKNGFRIDERGNLYIITLLLSRLLGGDGKA